MEPVSIIVPVYNAQGSLARCIESILQQTYSNIELILIDDGSSDLSGTICDQYAQQSPYVRVIHQENQGVSAARNMGIAQASGNYILFVDADDWLLPDGLFNLMESRISGNDNVLICGSYIIEMPLGRKKSRTYQNMQYHGSSLLEGFDDLFSKTHHAPWAKLYSRKLLIDHKIRFPAGIPYAEDSVFLVHYCTYIDCIITTSKVVCHYDYTNYFSAEKKYYPEVYKYFKAVLQQRQIYYIHKGCPEIYHKQESALNEFYLNWCLNHCVLRAPKYDRINLLIRSAKSFSNISDSYRYAKDLRQKNYRRVLLLWRIDHIRTYIKYKLFQLLHKIFLDI